MKILPNGIAVIEDDSHISKWVEECGRLDHDGCLEQFIIPLINPGQTVVDVGAFIGDHTIAYAKRVGWEGRVTAIEPNDEAFACLVWNTKMLPNVTRHCCAVGDHSGMCSVRRMNNAGKTFTCSGQSRIMTTLDHLCNYPVHFLKIDAEGMEPFILYGARQLLKERPKVLCEINVEALYRYGHSPQTIYVFFDDLGYSYAPLTKDCSLSSMQFDLLATPK